MVVRNSPAALVGYACRLPGAPSPEAFWSVLGDGRCTISNAPAGRWPVGRFLHPRATEPGFAYTFAGGYLDDPFGFDAAAFGISPREAQQMDPQQRLLLEVVWEALEDAGIPASSLAGEAVGVYVGASNVDYQSAASLDLAAIESHFMTGNSLSIASNRISYIFDWRGPSFTLDSACSSSFVAMAQAMAAIEAGLVDTAVVAGVNMLLSPAPFVGFSRARMLSPTGLCRPFSGAADGYVRSEGAVAMVLRRASKLDGLRARAHVLRAGVNSDGRTVGISLPSEVGQRSLLERMYAQTGVTPDMLAFMEAHGTGTRVGDPAEARAIGLALGQKRSRPLPIGSAKSNVGHLESASGMVGLLKAVMSLEHREFPRTLHLGELNPDIDFEGLGLAPATEPVALGEQAVLHAGVCNYGFGGTNAHVVISSAQAPAPAAEVTSSGPQLLMLSAHGREALAALASRHLEALDGGASAGEIASATAYQRDRLMLRAAIPLAAPDTARTALAALANGQAGAAVEGGALMSGGRLAFVYSGNGAQWPGMAKAALSRSPGFRRHFERYDAIFRAQGGWSPLEMVHSATLASAIVSTSIAQPLLFTIQSALTDALADYGVRPGVVLGHSVGEIAAARAAGILSAEEGVRLIMTRSRHQEVCRGLGKMAVLACDEARAAAILSETARSGVEIAAVNGPSSVTISGVETGVRRVLAEARAQRIAAVLLDLDYSFHSALLDGARDGLTADLSDLSLNAGTIPFISSVTGGLAAGETLDADYWWANVRRPVQFRQAVESAAAMGATLFLECGAKPLLTASIGDTLGRKGLPGLALASLSESDDGTPADPVLGAVARVLVHGGAVDDAVVFGAPPALPVPLPSYPWQRQRYVLPRSNDGLTALGDPFSGSDAHPLLGFRMAQGSPEWRSVIDPELVPYLADHRVDGEAVMPAAGLIEMVLVVARTELGGGAIEIEDLDILQALTLSSGSAREVSTTFDQRTGHVTIRSRARFAADEWTVHARGRIRLTERLPGTALPALAPGATDHEAEEVYACAKRHGLGYGPAFQLVTSARWDGDVAHVNLAQPRPTGDGDADPHLLHPASIDAALHSLFLDVMDDEEPAANLPVRIARISVWRDKPAIGKSVLQRLRDLGRTTVVSMFLLTADGEIVAALEGLVLRSVPLGARGGSNRTLRLDWIDRPRPVAAEATAASWRPEKLAPESAAKDVAAWRLVQAVALAAAYRTAREAIAQGEPAPHIAGLLDHLAANGLAEHAEAGWVVPASPGLHAPEDLLAALVKVHPHANAEILLCTHVLNRMAGRVHGGAAPPLPEALMEHFETESVSLAPVAAVLAEAVERWLATRAGLGTSVLLCPPWNGALLEGLLPLAAEKRLELLLAGDDLTLFQAAMTRLGFPAGVRFADLSGEAGAPADLAVALTWGRADDLLDPAAVSRWPRAGADWLQMIAPDDLAFSVLLDAAAPQPEVWRAMLTSAGFTAAVIHEDAGSGWTTLTAHHAGPSIGRPAARTVLGGAGETAFGRDLAIALGDSGKARGWELADGAATGTDRAGSAPRALTLIDATFLEPEGDAVAWLRDSIMRLRARIARAQDLDGDVRLWVVTRGATADASDPAAAALWAFGRVAINEFPTTDIRLLDLDPALTPSEAIARLAETVDAPGREREIAVRRDAWSVPRAARGTAPALSRVGPDRRTVLRFPRVGRLSDAIWEQRPRLAPGPGQVEVEVSATGLNFRDVMLGMGLLDEDLLGAGMSAASVGFEMAGVVARVGEGVDHLAPGDAVMGFAAGAFASHVTAPAMAVARIPDGVAPEAAATIPVAFSTAWYGLVTVAGLQQGETVLIHGAAGGVGIAAVQIALARGARVLATAGREDRRSFARLIGAEAVYDSRSLRFADEIRRDHGGVDVVLNSVAGEAMLQSLRLVRPFGRFVELGKRDYLDNTSIDLRPFLKNIAYFGVDLDHLLKDKPERAAAVLREVLDGFAAGAFSPLPYRVFPPDRIAQAFRLMQGSGHVGKIVIEPARAGVARAQPVAPFSAPDGPILVLGGTAGFGFETACWLAERGARTLVLGSRRGVVDARLEARLRDLQSRGVTVAVETVDATDDGSVHAFVAGAARRFGPIQGAVHTAMVLSDGLIESLTGEALESVLAPKLRGVLSLEAALEGQPLSFFVAYSSATTLIGSPGQGAYVAANAFLEGVMRRRRAAGRPGLAVAWGAIADAGVLADRQELAERLRRTTGVVGIPVADAVNLLGEVLARGDDADPVVYISEIATTEISERLALLQSPAFEGLRSRGTKAHSSGDSTDLMKQILEAGEDERLRLVLAMLAEEVGGILQIPSSSLDPLRPLSDLGMDSLMALELRMEVEKRCGMDLPLVSIAGQSLRDLAGRLLGGIAPATVEDAPARPNALQALGEVHAAGAKEIELDLDDLEQQVESAAAGSRRLM